MEVQENDKVRYLSFKNQISDEICSVVELCDNGKTIRLKKPNGEIMRIHHDRIRSLEKETQKSEPKSKEKDTNKFDPWEGVTEGEVWLKQSKFNDSVILKSFTIINTGNNTYKSINIYNDKFNNAGIKDYKLDNYKSLTSKLEKKGYKKIAKGNAK